MRRLKKNSLGAMLLMALILLGVLWFVVLGFANTSVRSLKLAQRGVALDRAGWAAESGLRLALQALAKDSTYTPPTDWVALAHNTTDKYKVVIYKETSTPKGVTIPTGCVYVVATGTERTGVTRKVAAVVKLGSTAKSLLNFSVFANALSLNGGCKIDSFDSKVSPLLRGSLANVATNSITAGAISLVGGSWIQGTVQVGVGGKVGIAKPLTPTTNTGNVVWKDWSCWSLGESAMTSALEFPKVSAPAASNDQVNVNWKGADLPAGSYGDLRANGGGEVRLSGGTYVFKSINLSGGARLSFTGTSSKPAVVYITQDLDLSGGTLYNTSAQPKNMVFMLAKDVKGKMTGGASAFAVVYGPEADFEITGGTDLYGAIVGRKVTLQSGASIHYDTDLIKNPPAAVSSTSTSGTSIISWQRS